jgi:hypothetical protein
LELPGSPSPGGSPLGQAYRFLLTRKFGELAARYRCGGGPRLDKASGDLLLTISDHLPWEENEDESSVLIVALLTVTTIGP